MTPTSTRRWEWARRRIVRRWEEIARRIEVRDERGVVALANLLDEFCELAAMEREAAAGRRDDPAVPVLRFRPEDSLSGRCVFCRAFVSLGGCFGPTHALNKAMLSRSWESARRIALDQIQRLRDLSFEPPPDEGSVH